MTEKRPPFRMVPDALIDAPWCGPYELAVYVAIRKLAAPGDTAQTGYDDIADVFGISTKQVGRAIAHLEPAFLYVERANGSHNRYTVRDRPMVGVVDRAETPADLARTVEVVSAANRAAVAEMIDGLASRLGAVRHRPAMSTTEDSQTAVSQTAVSQSATEDSQSATEDSQSHLSATETRRDKKDQHQEAASG